MKKRPEPLWLLGQDNARGLFCVFPDKVGNRRTVNCVSGMIDLNYILFREREERHQAHLKFTVWSPLRHNLERVRQFNVEVRDIGVLTDDFFTGVQFDDNVFGHDMLSPVTISGRHVSAAWSKTPHSRS